MPPIIKNHIFSHICVLCAFAFLCSLGSWQLLRWQEKKQLLAAEEQAQQTKPLGMTDLMSLYKAPEHSQVKLLSPKAHAAVFLLDNQIHQGRVGYDVINVLMLSNQKALLVNRGFIPRDADRNSLPEVDIFPKDLRLSGILRSPSKPPFVNHPFEDQQLNFPKRIQYIDTKQLEELLGFTIHPQVLILTEASAAVFEPKPSLKAWLTPERHLGYSIQWFSLALCCLIIYIIVLRQKGLSNE
jgi:surfeit locus 1 family protein